MKIIDLINMRAEGKEMPKKIRVDHWCYNFEWIEHESNYYDRNAEIDLMSCLSMDKEELNYEVEILDNEDEEKKIPEKLKSLNYVGNVSDLVEFEDKQQLNNHLLKDKLNEVIQYLQYIKSKGE